MTDEMARVLETLRPGREHAQTLQVIARRTNLPRREVEAAIQQLRLDGHPIATATSGVMGAYLARDAHELEPCVKALRVRASHQHETASALERTLERMRAPVSLWEGVHTGAPGPLNTSYPGTGSGGPGNPGH